MLEIVNLLQVIDATEIDNLLTELSNPSVSSIIKKISAQKVDPGIVAMAAGYTTNTRPGPSVATSWTSLPDA